VWEETTEIIIWAKNNDKENVIYEISDLLYFLNVLMVYSWIQPYQIADELSSRFWTSWIEEKNNRKK
jgi:phosphoribosyl-ATP pyrophosphohydrolase/phosphoribosyl-AMP cyclohydrolase